jgi:predicted nucleic acid-binding Zn ribbon protein
MGPGSAANHPKTLKRAGDVQLLGEVLESVMAERVCAGYERAVLLRQAWVEVVPAELAAHCKLKDLSGNVLKIAADSPAYMHELRLYRKELVEQIRSVAPRAGVKDIRITTG